MRALIAQGKKKHQQTRWFKRLEKLSAVCIVAAVVALWDWPDPAVAFRVIVRFAAAGMNGLGVILLWADVSGSTAAEAAACGEALRDLERLECDLKQGAIGSDEREHLETKIAQLIRRQLPG